MEGPSGAKGNAFAQAQAYHATLLSHFEADLVKFRRAASGSNREVLRRTVISEAVNLVPPPGIP